MTRETAMRYTNVRVDLVLKEIFLEPFLQLPARAGEILERYYRALSPQHRLSLNDLKSYGGSTYGDVRLVVENTFSGKGNIAVTPELVYIEILDLVQDDNDLKMIKDHMALCEETLKAALGGMEFGERMLTANVWASCEGGLAAARAFLEERGNAALKLDGEYATIEKEFVLQCGLRDYNAANLRIGIELSRLDTANLFISFDHTVFSRGQTIEGLASQFDRAYAERENLLRHIGLTQAPGNE